MRSILPIPAHFQPEKASEIFQVNYARRAEQAKAWKQRHKIPDSAEDTKKVALFLIDIQNTFCIPSGELFVAGKSGTGAIDDNKRLCEFLYRNLMFISEIILTLDTHYPLQIFHPIFWIDPNGNNPIGGQTIISYEDVKTGRWKINPAVARSLGIEANSERFALHYVKTLHDRGKFPLMIWPYHAMFGGIGHALVSIVEEAVFFHSIVRSVQPIFEIKGNNPFTENYSVMAPEIDLDPEGQPLGRKNKELFEKLFNFDAVIVAGQAKSHCVAWTLDDILLEIKRKDPLLARKFFLIDDCCSPVVIPNVVDFSEQAEQAFQKFAEAGMNRVRSDQPIEQWLKI